jgi:hypothetical protein
MGLHDLTRRSSSAWEKRTRQTQDLVCLAEVAHFSLERLDTILFGGLVLDAGRNDALAGLPNDAVLQVCS